ncbi:hypothetical protein [Metapseudomonas otitidis]|uniref:hypothetical protein n=1 Tax=Metapseudomonas otitidis TaxID=319939 RepID=UPI0013F60F63|nr:hypothetical protein [Pseudomonas otitidis]
MNSFFNQSRSSKLIQNLHLKTTSNELAWYPEQAARVLFSNTDALIPSCYTTMLNNKDKAYLYAIRYKRYDGELEFFYPVESYQVSIIDKNIDMILYQSDYDEPGLFELFHIISAKYSGLESYFN